MSWKWIHAPEAYANAMQNLLNKDKDWLNQCWAEIRSSVKEELGDYHFDDSKYEGKYVIAKNRSAEALAEDILAFMEQLRTCNNGGFKAWACPFGCHTVSFDLEN